MNRQKAESLILFAYSLKDHKEYLGSLKTLRHISKADKTLNRLMNSEGLI
ncbi:MAG: hypothetical protein GTO02_07830 [Candidatus Dadabacteria bacterium]|nr:hypothetical protein [Candidatus Dadabacteria bacterium]